MKTLRWTRSSRLAATLGILALAGCLGRPDIDQRWTNIEMVSSNVDPESTPDLGSAPTFEARARITYREILTGFLVAELRASSTVNASMVELNPQEQRIGTARDVDLILENSVTAGRDVQAVTGYPELVQETSFEFEAFDPSQMLLGSVEGLFLVVYMGSGEEIELEDGRDSLVVDPFLSSEYDILTQGIAVPLDPPPTP